MANKKELNPTSIQTNKFIAGKPEKEKIKAQVQFRHDLLESQKTITRMNLIDYRGVRKYQD